MDNYYWKLSQGAPLNDGPLLSKEYDLKAPACEFWNDFIGPCNWLYSLSGESDHNTESEGRMLRVMSFDGCGESITNDNDGGMTRLTPLTGTSISGINSKGMLNSLWGLNGKSDAEHTGDGVFLKVVAIDGQSEIVTYWRNEYYWKLSEGTPLNDGPLLSKEYNLNDPAYVFWDDFIGQHRDFIVRLRAIDGESKVQATPDGNLALLWNLLGVSETEVENEGVLALNWSLAGNSLILTEDTGNLALLWGLAGSSMNVIDGSGKPLRVRQVLGKSITLSTGEGKAIKWPLTLIVDKQEILTVKLGVERLTYIGNTLRLTAEFRNSSGELEDPGDVFLRISDSRWEVIEEFPVPPYSQGKYRHDYTIPKTPLGELFFEYVGKLGNRTILKRSNIERIWSDPL